MVKFRSFVFWLHLACGIAAGSVILIMSVTGVLLTYQRQIIAWADTRGYHIVPAAQRLSVDTLIAKAAESRPDLTPSAVVIRSDATEPASLTVGAGRQLFVDPYTGTVLGEGSGQSVRAFFRGVVEWHRYLAASGARRPTGRAVTGAANFIFLFIIISGLFLWWPRALTQSAIRNIAWFRRGLRGRPRDFNWHNTVGFWSAIPLAIIVAGGVVISYPWATALVYHAYGEVPPVGRAAGTVPGATTATAVRAGELPIETAVSAAGAKMPEWKSMTVAVPPQGAAHINVTLDAGDGGQPQKRATITLDRRTGAVLMWEPFESQSPARQARMWLRFAHTGEVYGMPGQTIAGIVRGRAAVLVWTGLTLVLRRLLAWRRRHRVGLQKAA
jgi:uncharacterized iron-regulated membrane protein